MISIDYTVHTIAVEMLSVPVTYDGMSVQAQVPALMMELVPDNPQRGRVLTVPYVPASETERDLLLSEFGFGAKVTLTLASTAAGLTPAERMDAAHAANVELAAVAEPASAGGAV